LNERLRQLARYCVIGLASAGLALAILAGLHSLLGINYLVAYCIAFATTNVTGYLLNARFTFSTASDHRGALRYMAINAALLGVNTAAMKLLVDVLAIWYLGAAILLAILNAPLSFIAQRLVVYRPEPPTSAAQP
jgi:putative flippase GtrA